ncbi:hypothetical protein R6Q59_006334, partial [Mikania micrantha]
VNRVPSTSSTELKVFYLKMKGDYHQYLVEFKVGEQRFRVFCRDCNKREVLYLDFEI